MNTKQKYKLVWLPCSDKNNLAEKFYVPSYRKQLPFLINNEEQSKQFSISEKDLLLGILVGIEDIESDNSYGIDADKDTLLYLLDVLGNGFQFKTPEKMILDLSHNFILEKEHVLARKILKFGTSTIPTSSKIKCDLIMVDWEILALETAINNDIYFIEIISLFYSLDFDNILKKAKENACYYGFCALILSKAPKQTQDEFYNNFIIPNVKNRKLKKQIKVLIKNKESLNVTDLLII